jgi:hypothetical protein
MYTVLFRDFILKNDLKGNTSLNSGLEFVKIAREIQQSIKQNHMVLKQ